MEYPFLRSFRARRKMRYLQDVYNYMEGGACRRFINGLVINPRGKRILDVGCGPGQLLIELANDTPSTLVGSDMDECFLRFLSGECVRRGISCCCQVKADAVRLPFPDNSFDIVFCLLTLPYVEDDQKAVAELVRILDWDGILVISGHGQGFPLSYMLKFNYMPLLQYPLTWVYSLTGKKLVRKTLQHRKTIYNHLTQNGISVEQIQLTKGAFGLVSTFTLKGTKTNRPVPCSQSVHEV